MKQKEITSSNSSQLKLTDVSNSSGGFVSQRRFDKNNPRQKAITDTVIKMIVRRIIEIDVDRVVQKKELHLTSYEKAVL